MILPNEDLVAGISPPVYREVTGLGKPTDPGSDQGPVFLVYVILGELFHLMELPFP